MQAYDEDIQVRIHGLEHADPNGYKVNAHEIEPGLVYKDGNVKVRAFRVAHGSWRHAYGFRFETADRTIVISGDTVPHPNIVKHSRGCDVLVLYYQLFFGTTESALVGEIQRLYDGPAVSGHDLDVYLVLSGELARTKPTNTATVTLASGRCLSQGG